MNSTINYVRGNPVHDTVRGISGVVETALGEHVTLHSPTFGEWSALRGRLRPATPREDSGLAARGAYAKVERRPLAPDPAPEADDERAARSVSCLICAAAPPTEALATQSWATGHSMATGHGLFRWTLTGTLGIPGDDGVPPIPDVPGPTPPKGIPPLSGPPVPGNSSRTRGTGPAAYAGRRNSPRAFPKGA